MRSKVIKILMITFILNIGFSSFVYAAFTGPTVACIEHNYVESTIKTATCTSKGKVLKTCIVCKKTETVTIPATGHTPGSWNITKKATCTTDGKKEKRCTVCNNILDTDSIKATGHSFGNWKIDEDNNCHIRYCQNEGCSKFEMEAHNNNNKVAINGNSEVHQTYCSACNKDMGEEKHPSWTDGETSPHKCTACKYTRTSNDQYQYHCYNVTNGSQIRTTMYVCLLCNNPNRLKLADNTVKGMEIADYACSDAEINIGDIPEFPTGTYTASWSGTLREKDGNVITNLSVPDEWITLYGWTQRCINTHSKDEQEYKDEYIKNLIDILINEYGDVYDAIRGAYIIANQGEIVTEAINLLATRKFGEWVDIFKTSGLVTIKNGNQYTATQSYSNGTFSFKFNHSSGGWMFDNSLIFYTTNGTNALLYKKGNYEKEGPENILANVYYCYRTTDNEIPKNGYSSLYKHSSVSVYNNGRKTTSVNVSADMDKIDSTGYRYVGYNISTGSISSVSVSKYNEKYKKDSTTATATVGFNYTESDVIVTFFVEPVKLYFGHVSTDYNGRLQNITASNQTNTTGLEFPDYYNGTRCEIEVKSLNKFYWPGFILQDAKTFKYGGNGDISTYSSTKAIWEKEYDADETTVYEPNATGNRLTVTTVVPSRYTSKGKNEKLNITETTGKAADKQFYYYYNTPTLKIEHKDYDTNTLLKDNNNKEITYLTQILHQYALVNSLITDNIGNNGTNIHSFSINDLETGNVKNFAYNFGSRDLVQVEIYEIDSSGRETHYGTLYNDNEYKPSKNGYKVENYAGVFEKYYTDTLSNIVSQIGKTGTTFNTNKNWRIVFKYVPVERVYISFMDLKGNKIFIKDSSGKYVPEITSKIDKTNGYTHTVTDLGSNGNFKAIGYTESKDAYIKDYSKATETSNGVNITVPGKDGDRYIVIFYSTEKTVLVEYKDKNGNTIKDPTTLEVPDNGTTVKVPVINLYKVVDYKLNPNYDGNSATTEAQPASPLTEQDDIISVPSTGNNQHIIIYYEQQEGLKIDYREVGTEAPLPVPPEYTTTTEIEIPEEGIRIKVPEVPGYVVKYYKHNDNYNGSDTTITGPERTPNSEISVAKNGNNQYIIIYYEKNKETSKLIIEYRKETPDGTNPEEGEELKEPTTIEIPINEETKITPPDIEDYTPIKWVDPDKNINEDITNIIIVGEPDKEKKIIIIYKTYEDVSGGDDEPVTPGIITPDDNAQKVILRANSKGAEEYNVSVAIPTSEDLYTEGEVYSYRFLTDIVEAPMQEKVKVKIIQKYYKDVDNLSDIGEVKTDVIEVDLKYNYYDIKKAELYDLKQMTILNDAIKNYDGYDYDTGATGIYEEGKATLGVTKNIPHILYELPQGVGTEATNKIQIKTNAGYSVKKNGDVYEITLKDIAYVKPNVTEFKNSYKIEAESILEKCTFIKVPTLSIQMAGTEDVTILTGKQYNLLSKVEALKSTDYFVQYTAGRAPLYSFYKNKDLFVQEKALNKTYETKFEGDYRLIEAVINNDTEIKKYEPKNGTKLGVEKLIIDALNIHTPIVNTTTLTPATDNTNSTQLANKNDNLSTYNGSTVLNLDKQFTITIPNAANHISSTGYGNRNYNVDGTKANDTNGTANADRMSKNYQDMITEDYLKKYGTETEENSYGPTFAEQKLIKFPYDVYLLNPDLGDATRQQKGEPQLLKAGVWYNLYDYIKPSIATYTFVLPVWAKDAYNYKAANGEGIYVLVVAENCPEDKLLTAITNPNSVNKSAQNDKANYILGKSFDTYVSGRVYDIEIRDTDDPGYMNKVQALKCAKLPLAQAGQVKAYKMGLKLGYRFYFDVKTKGISNNSVGIRPKIYYVPATGGTATDDISLFYHTNKTLYNKLSQNDLSVNMTMSATHGNINNTEFTTETVAAKALNTSRIFTTKSTIGKLINGLVLKIDTEKLPYNNLNEEMAVCGFGDFGLEKFLASAKQSATINGNENNIRNASGHWYGEYYLPASTLVYKGANTDRNAAIAKTGLQTSGYLIVAFEEITTGTNETGAGYLSYDKPNGNTQWQKENAHQNVTLPNGKTATVNTSGIPMAIYQVGLKANNDYETEGTH